MKRAVIGGRTPREFLERYWQKRPLLVRGALRDLDVAIQPAALCEVACRPDVSSRLITVPRADQGWTVRHGPFARSDLVGLPETGWTLLVQEADRRFPACAELLEQFRFIPNWRVDDVMVSHATDGAGVGPHVDRYDVFLCQAHGRRRWRITSEPLAEVRLLPGVELPVLETFEPDQEWVLEPGDLLYLPPGLAHEGVALGDSLTCSVGFRAPDPRELCSSFLRQLPPRAFEAIRYADPDLAPAEQVGEIAPEARRRLAGSAGALFGAGGEFDRWIGRYVTKPRHEPRPAKSMSGLTVAGLRRRLESGESLKRSAPPHFAWFTETGGDVLLFVGGEVYRLDRGLEPATELLCGREALDRASLGRYLDREAFVAILVDLLLRGFLVPLSVPGPGE